jgi:type IV secretory pathway TraG/TraD family ATPase VirD4
MRSLLNQKSSFDRRLWCIADELPSLQKLKDLDTFLVEGRKYGGCGLFAIQSPAQLEMIYGRDVAKIITGNCLTKVAFYEHDPQIAMNLSRMFGEREVKEFQEGISYGAHQMRDGVNISGQTRNKPVVSATDLHAIRANRAFVKLPGDFPVSKVKIPISKY